MEEKWISTQLRCILMYFDVLISLSLDEYIKALVWDFPVMTTLSVNKGYII